MLQCFTYAIREVSVCENVVMDQDEKKRVAWGDFRSTDEVLKKTKSAPDLFDTTVLPVLNLAPENWVLRKQDEQATSAAQT